MQQSIKDHLVGRAVNVRLISGKIIVGHISGRFMPFAHVTWHGSDSTPCGIEAAWETVMKCVSNNAPISV